MRSVVVVVVVEAVLVAIVLVVVVIAIVDIVVVAAFRVVFVSIEMCSSSRHSRSGNRRRNRPSPISSTVVVVEQARER